VFSKTVNSFVKMIAIRLCL